MKAIILYDSRSEGGSTDRLVDAIGQKLAGKGMDVEKARCRAQADYSFISEFDLVIMGAPVYYLMVSSQLLGALIQSNLSSMLKNKNTALFLACGSPQPMAELLYMPQMKMNLQGSRILAEKVFAPAETSDMEVIGEYVDTIYAEWLKEEERRGKRK
ncbi:flavodoxin domain-containing protein [Chlorobium phaeovibrioides]|uniref:Protochlorophyllide oxidoreductase n=1 Tax=Chlorobium phaeovibrioides TaxID=1094 RepID=A0A432AWF1_CHLPH|nr:flavodoxin domain-containing protein [Chlorobium phaeovibrioides]MWV53961.1 protochlorophyllide oxidoreductase [Chlorobium phaeovibrioides]QEQ56659.1 protochlorophyllide oxidoreductase [Chlorobium phaeovibrioides]RTY38852.1 protochlorophyllide oxidoreductase [Chlorobium phaeovibrioides]